MKTSSRELKKDLHDLANALHNAYETLENVELSINDDPEFCKRVIQITKLERDSVYASMDHLRKILKEMNIYE